jgi:hypothetical protein
LSLRNHTERQARTLTDLQYDQVLDNIAMFVEEPNALPFFSTALAGQTSNNYTANPASTLGWSLNSFNAGPPLFYFSQLTSALGGTFTANEQWGTNSVLNPDVLLLMRCVYQKVVGRPCCDGDGEKKLEAYFAGHPGYLEAMRPGWYGVGRRCDVPACAVHVRHYNKTSVWVTPEGVDSLTRLTLAILDLATAATPLLVPDPTAVAVARLTAQARDLSSILSQYPLKPGEPPGSGYVRLKTDLDNTMIALSIVLEGKDPREVLARAAVPVTQRYAVLDKNSKITGFESKTVEVPLTPEMRTNILNLLTNPPPTGEGLQFRARKDFFYPPPPTLGPTFLPGR